MWLGPLCLGPGETDVYRTILSDLLDVKDPRRVDRGRRVLRAGGEEVRSGLDPDARAG